MQQQRSHSFSYHHSRMGSTVPVESDLTIMTRDSENYVKKIEQEVKKLHSIRRQYKQIQQERDERLLNCKVLKRNLDASIHKLNNVKNRTLVKQKQHYLKKHDEITEKLAIQKRDIDNLRKSRLRNIEIIQEQQILIEQKQKQIELTNEILEERRLTALQQQDQMYEINQRHQQNKENYQRKFDQIQKLMDEEQRKKNLVRKQELKSKKNDRGGIDQLTGTFDTASILKRRLQRLILKNKEKVKIMDAYMRSLSIIDNSFNQIKETTGITDIKEIESTFIKSEEQNHQLLTYVDLLHQEIDNLEDQNAEIKRKIQQQQGDNEQKRHQLEQTPGEVTQQNNLKAIIDKKQEQVQEFTQFLEKIQPKFEESLKDMVQSCFNRDQEKKFQYQDTGIHLNDKTLETYLGDLENLSNQILAYKSHKCGLPQTTNLLINDIPIKDFAPRINKPVSINQNNMDYIPREDKRLVNKEDLEQFAMEHIERKMKNRDTGSAQQQFREYQDDDQLLQQQQLQDCQ